MSSDRRGGGPRAWRAFAALIALASSLSASRAARANDLDTFGFGARQQAMGSAFTGLASDFTACYYNPAGLVGAHHYSVGVGYQYVDYRFDFRSQNPGSIPGFKDDDVERVTPLRGVTLGFSGGLPRGDDPRVGFGIGMFLPTDRIISAFSTRETEVPDIFYYGKRRDKLGIYPAVAVKLVDSLSIGGGLAILADLAGGVAIDISSAQGNTEVDFDQKLKYDAAPNVGISWRPLDGLSFGATYRGELSLKVTMDTVVQLAGVNLTNIEIEAITLFTPQQVAVGLAWDPVDSLTLAFDFTWYDFSTLEHPFTVVTPPGNIAGRPGFRDIFVPRFGVEYVFEISPPPGAAAPAEAGGKAGEEPRGALRAPKAARPAPAEEESGFLGAIALRAGYQFVPTPIPDQSDRRTNFVDGDKHVASAGIGFYFNTDPLTDLDLFAQIHLLTGADATKTGPPGSWEADGWALNFGIQFNIRM